MSSFDHVCPNCDETITVRLCDNCGERPASLDTTDHQVLCDTCAQDSHIPCDVCGLVVPAIDVDTYGTCWECREKEARLLWVHGKSAKKRKKGERWLNLLKAEQILLLLHAAGHERYQGLSVGDALYGVRAAMPHP